MNKGPLVNEETHEFYDRETNQWLCGNGRHTHCVVAWIDGQFRYCYGITLDWYRAKNMHDSDYLRVLVRILIERAWAHMAEETWLDPHQVVWTGRGLR